MMRGVCKRRTRSKEGDWSWVKVDLCVREGMMRVGSDPERKVQEARLWAATSSAARPRGFDAVVVGGEVVSFIAEGGDEALAWVDALNDVDRNSLGTVSSDDDDDNFANDQLTKGDAALKDSLLLPPKLLIPRRWDACVGNSVCCSTEEAWTQTDADDSLRELNERVATLALERADQVRASAAARRSDSEVIRQLEHDRESLRASTKDAEDLANRMRLVAADGVAEARRFEERASRLETRLRTVTAQRQAALERCGAAEEALEEATDRAEDLWRRLDVSQEEARHHEQAANRLKREQRSLVAALEDTDRILYGSRSTPSERRHRAMHLLHDNENNHRDTKLVVKSSLLSPSSSASSRRQQPQQKKHNNISPTRRGSNKITVASSSSAKTTTTGNTTTRPENKEPRRRLHSNNNSSDLVASAARVVVRQKQQRRAIIRD